ncbi:MAG: S8 family serine peptidase [Aquificae bacterium]|nr:S8 family serine peptidase [Aquificota bacterium]
MKILIVLLIVTISLAKENFEGYLIKIKPDKISTQQKKQKSSVILVKDQKKLQNLLKDTKILQIEPNYKLRKVQTLSVLIPNDPCFKPPGCNFQDIGYVYQWGLYKIRAPESWYKLDQIDTTGFNTVYIAILDTGVDFDHEDLVGKVWKNPDEICDNGIDDDNNGYIDDCYGWNALSGKGDALDEDGHGTHIAGIISAIADNLRGIAGATWKTDVKIIPCKMLDANGEGTLFDEINCLDYISSLKQDKNLNIIAINASYGGEYYSSIEKSAIDDLKNSNILFVTASGNEGMDNETIDFSPCNYDLPNEICVGATNINDQRAVFSNYGKTKVKIFAPGENIVSTYPNNNYALIDGTSQAVPFVSAVVGMYSFLNPNTTYLTIKNKILLSGTNLSSLYGYSYTCNRLDMYNVLFDDTLASKICIDASKLYFKVLENSDIEQIVTIRSTGNLPLSINSITPQGNNIEIKNDTCSGANLDSLEECTFTVYISKVTDPIFEEILISSSVGDNYLPVEVEINQLPVIKAIDVEPDNPDVNEVVYLYWKIYNPDNDTLTCKVDIDGDGDYEKTIEDCQEEGFVSFKYDKEGKYNLIFVVDDGYSVVKKSISVPVGDVDDGSTGCTFSKKTDLTLLLTVVALFAFFLRRKSENL